MAARFSRRAMLATAAATALAPRLARAAGEARLITIGAPTTEIVYALGAGDLVVATDTTSRFPQEAASLPKVGYMRALAAEGLLSLAPNRIIAQEGSGPPEVLARVREAGIAVDEIPERPDLATLEAKITLIAERLGRQQQGAELAARLREQLQALAPARSLSALCLIHPGGNGWMAAGQDTIPDLYLRLAGARNSIGFSGIKPLSMEAAIAGAPELLVISSSALAQAGGLDGLLSLPHLAATPAAAARRVVVLEAQLLLGLGPRSPLAVQQLARVIQAA
ncbi:MAG: hemin ABC transporter substrate-binding protein [Magnetospirillum sp.]